MDPTELHHSQPVMELHTEDVLPAPSCGEPFVRNSQCTCDFCKIESFLNYEEACAHEAICSRPYHEPQPYHDSRHTPRPPLQGYNNQMDPATGRHSQNTSHVTDLASTIAMHTITNDGFHADNNPHDAVTGELRAWS